MCFSAAASLTTGTVLVAAGAYCITAAHRKNRAYLSLAVMPLLFGVQQFCEAGVWAGLNHGWPTLVAISSLGFLFFAAVFWPTWVPIAIATLEERRARRTLIYPFTAVGIGFLLVVYLPVVMHADNWLAVTIVHHSLRYDLAGVPAGVFDVSWGWQVMYLAAVAGPLLLCGNWRIQVMGVAIVMLGIVTGVLFRYAFASIWCFFAAILSSYICYVLYRVKAPPAVSAAPAV